MGKTGAFDEAVLAVELALPKLDHISALNAERLRIELYWERALAYGDCSGPGPHLREFKKAQEDLDKVLELDPKHVQAKKALKNCKEAMKRQRGAKDLRWYKSLDVEPIQESAEWVSTCLNVSSLVLVILVGSAIVWFSGDEQGG